MNLSFTDINETDFYSIVNKAKTISCHGILNKYKQKEIRDFAYELKDPLSENELRFIYSLENAVNVKETLCSEQFDPHNFTMQLPTTLLEKTKTGAILTIDERTLNNGGGLGKFVCDHAARVNQALLETSLIGSLQITGFLHVPEFPSDEQFSEVIGLAVKGSYNKYAKEKEPFRILLTGFTCFKRVKDNPTGRFLFGDGVSREVDTLTFKNPASDAVERLDNMMKNQFGKSIISEELYINDLKVGRRYKLPDNNIIDLILVRLPVDTNIHRQKPKNYIISETKPYSEFMAELNDNIFGDRVQHILTYTSLLTKPNAIISFGAHCLLPSDFYEIETDIYGLEPKYSKGIRPVYPGNSGKGKNTDLAEVYKSALLD